MSVLYSSVESKLRWKSSVTTHQYHAQEYVKAVDLTRYDGIASVGGDGMLSEVR